MLQKYEEFLEREYKAKLIENIRKGNNYIEIDFRKIAQFDVELSERLLDDPEESIKLIEEAAKDLMEMEGSLQALFFNLPESTKIPLNDISDQLDKFLTFEGYIMKPSEIYLKARSAKFECPSCSNVLNVLMIGREFKEPTNCGCGRKGKFNIIGRPKYVKFQKFDLVEAMDTVPERPRKLTNKSIYEIGRASCRERV